MKPCRQWEGRKKEMQDREKLFLTEWVVLENSNRLLCGLTTQKDHPPPCAARAQPVPLLPCRLPVNGRIVWVAGAVYLHHVLAQYIHVPHYLGATGKVVGAFRCYGPLGGRAVVVLAAHFHGKN